MTTAMRQKVIGEPIDRVDGPLKVTGAAAYPSDFAFPDLAHAVLVQSTIAAGRITAIDAAKAQAAPGVLAVITHENGPALVDGPMTPLGPSPPFPLKDNRIWHQGQHVAVVVARTREDARAAAPLVEIDYEEAAPVLRIDDPRAPMLVNKWGQDVDRGDVTAALSCAEVVYDETFTTAAVTPNPMGLFATVARWEGDRLTVHDASQDPMWVRTTLATVFELPETGVRVLVPYLGGGFGAGLRTWPHVILTALAARVVGRPVKLVLTRPQMFTSVGHRPESVQRVRLGATREGRLVAIDHSSTSTMGPWTTAASTWSRRSRPTPTRARTSRPTTVGRGCTFQAPSGCGALARPRATSRSSPRSTSCPTGLASTRSSCAYATTPRFIRGRVCRGRA